jgi:general nucleoside transport system ATP-binding protein
MNVELRNINKSFGRVQANVGINLKIPEGKIHGILGENGAGKSTLMKVLSGFIQADSGEIFLDDRQVFMKSPAHAIQNGIGMLHQDPLDFPPMTVIDNFLIGQKGGLLPNRKALLHSFKKLQDQFGFSLDPEAFVDSMTVGERQQLEILRLLWMGVEVLILDEPTTGISSIQKTKLFDTLRSLVKEGKNILFVSHKLEDVELLCNDITVLARGELVGQVQPPYSTPQLVEMMFGKSINLGEKQNCSKEEIILTLSNVNIEDVRLQIKDVNLKVSCGEVIGIAGMEGSGQGLLLRTIAGLMRPVSGEIKLRSKDLTGKPYQAFLQSGISFMPASRMEEGLIPRMSLIEHVMLTTEQQGLFVNTNKAREDVARKISDFSIRGTATTLVEELSGGNQQRALLSLINEKTNLLLLEHPTRGLDIESTIYIWEKLKERCLGGASILFISPDLEEIMQYSDRILVFYNGRVSPPLKTAYTTLDVLGQLIGGKGWEDVFQNEELP